MKLIFEKSIAGRGMQYLPHFILRQEASPEEDRRTEELLIVLA